MCANKFSSISSGFGGSIRRRRLRRRQPEADRGGWREIMPLHDGVYEVSGSERHDVDRLRIDAGFLDDAGQPLDHACCDIGRSRCLEAEDDAIILHDRRVRIGSAHIDADSDHAPCLLFPAFRSLCSLRWRSRGRNAEPRIDLAVTRRCYAICSIGVYGSSMRKPLGPNTSSASGVRMIAGTATETTTTRWP
jgi:hypothetical protein